MSPVRFGYGLGRERFERFRFSVPAVPLGRGVLCFSVQFHREDGSGFGSVPCSVPAKTVLTVPVSGTSSVPGPPCNEILSGINLCYVMSFQLCNVVGPSLLSSASPSPVIPVFLLWKPRA